MARCEALTAANTNWSFCPNAGASYLFAILFGLATCAHVVQAVMYRKFYPVVIIMSGLWQTVAFAFRIVSIQNPAAGMPYQIWFILILTAPLWTNAFVYMVMGRMVYNFLTKQKLFGVKAWRFGLIFVLLDISAFLVQLYGAASASGSNVSNSQMLQGIHVYMIGIGIQETFLLFFAYLAFRFQQELAKESFVSREAEALRLLYVVYAVLVLITVRIIFRLVEYSRGLQSTIPNHEVFMYCFDSLPMLVALLLFNLVHPGRIMPGKESDFPSRKEKRRIKREQKARKAQNAHQLLPNANLSTEYGSQPAQENGTYAYQPTGSHASYDRGPADLGAPANPFRSQSPSLRPAHEDVPTQPYGA